ncbi:uncharacterized protein G2W53_027938 [Senna tora]|uniref:Uncharacterized protein n=1 Tax=Senna tora TaxID=362788 RepID=A0A834T165_9FABA|nr:uncharacterized protein G2W53_027938 [Senna tora]
MAINCTSSTQIPIQKSGSFLKIASRDLMSKRSSIPLRRSPFVLRIRASIKNKVYEDQSQGIVCYQDESGEIFCEGFDEGPRFQQTPKSTFHQRYKLFKDSEIIDLLLQQSWIQIVKGEEMKNHVKEDLNCNGFNSFC